MLFCTDIGNTNIVLGLIRDGQILRHWRVRTEREVTSDEFSILVSNLFKNADIEMGNISHMIVSCVVPPLLNTMEEFANQYLHLTPLIVGPDIETGMANLYDNPKEVGADRIVNAVGAYEKYKKAMVVVDFGTATTFDVVSGKGEYLGGAIAPGVGISCEASKLPRVEIFARPKRVIAKDTVSSMNVGIVYGYAGLVDGIVKRIQKEAGEKFLVIATGGLAPLICDVS